MIVTYNQRGVDAAAPFFRKNLAELLTGLALAHGPMGQEAAQIFQAVCASLGLNVESSLAVIEQTSSEPDTVLTYPPLSLNSINPGGTYRIR